MQGLMFAADGGPHRLGCVRVYFGDWRDVASQWPRDAVAIFDPPYGIRYASGMKGRGWSGRTDKGDARELAAEIVGDENTRERDDVLTRGWQAAAVFGPARLDRVAPWGDPRAVLIWDKGEGVGMGDLSFPWRPNFETIAIYGDGWAGSVSNGRHHPHEKPLVVMAELVSKAPAGAVVDPHAGSGSTLIAAALLGRDAWGAEIDPRYRDVILERLAANGIQAIEL